jgi:hypothetical protein
MVAPRTFLWEEILSNIPPQGNKFAKGSAKMENNF